MLTLTAAPTIGVMVVLSKEAIPVTVPLIVTLWAPSVMLPPWVVVTAMCVELSEMTMIAPVPGVRPVSVSSASVALTVIAYVPAGRADVGIGVEGAQAWAFGLDWLSAGTMSLMV